MATPPASELAEALSRDVRAWRKADLERRWSPAALRSAVRAGAVTRMFSGIFASALHSESFATRAHAACLWRGPGSVVIGAGAGSAWGFCDTPATVVLATAYSVGRDCPGWLQLRRFGEPVPSTYWGVVPIATAPWAAVTAYERAPSRDRDQYLYRVAQERLATPQQLLDAAAAIPRLRGRNHLKMVVDAIARGSESHLETSALRRVFNTTEFADFLRQHWIRTDGGAYRLDMFHPASRTAVELDGASAHATSTRRQYDITRDVDVARMGILTLRLSKRDVEERAAWCRESVTAVVDSRS